MKLSYNEATAMKCSTLEKDLELCEKVGFDFIEIRMDMLRDYLQRHTVDDLKSFFAQSRLKPHAFNAIHDINFCTKAEWDKIVNDFLFLCKVGEKIGNHYVVVVPLDRKEPSGRSEKEIFEDSVEALNKLADIGQDYGMNLGFEPVGNPGCCVRTVRQAWEIVKAVNRDNVGITVDAFNLYLYNKLNNYEDIKMVDRDKLFVAHVDDGDDRPLEELDHKHRCFPGEGVLNLKNYITTLKEMNYDGMVSIETFRPEYWEKDPEWVIKTAYETTKRLLESVGAL
ncbi:MAG: sugar phosphate isomerase/epimerase [Dethiobacteria bacterium]|jgi:2-keto-myo-inositol isomerase|nr:sugar phosphate isomerase/epimerase [Bacillota bacterium]